MDNLPFTSGFAGDDPEFGDDNQEDRDDLWKKLEQLRFRRPKAILVILTGFGEQWDTSYTHLLDVRSTEGEVTLGCGTWREQSNIKIFRGHKNVLEKRSGYCRRVFRTVDITMKPIFLFEKIKRRTMRHIIRFMYTGKITLNRDTELPSFMDAANQLDMNGLRPLKEYVWDGKRAKLPPKGVKIDVEDITCIWRWESYIQSGSESGDSNGSNGDRRSGGGGGESRGYNGSGPGSPTDGNVVGRIFVSDEDDDHYEVAINVM